MEVGVQQALQPSARAGRTGVVEFGLKRRQFGEQVIHRGMLARRSAIHHDVARTAGLAASFCARYCPKR